MNSLVQSRSFSISQGDVLYVAQQLNLDLQELSKAYPRLLSVSRALELFNSYTNFLINYAITNLGFSIHNPANNNLVYHELRYKVIYGGEVVRTSSNQQSGVGGQPIRPVSLPASAKFTPWLNWSNNMLSLSVTEQTRIVSGTGWNIPGKNGSFTGTYEGGNWNSRGSYKSGSLEASGREYRFGG